MEAKKVLRGFFWFAFAAFLAASIPHVAYFFRAFEPQDAGMDLWFWSVATFIAISIDVTVFLLSMTVASLHRQHASKGLIVSVWFFIIALAGLSWYMNNQYATHFADTRMIAATSLDIPWVGQIKDINPLIASCFQILAIAYTWIADKIAANETQKTAAQLEAEAKELEQISIQRQRIAAIKRANNKNFITNAISDVKEIKGQLFTRDQGQSSDDEQPQESRVQEQSKDRNTDELEALKLRSTATQTGDKNTNEVPHSSDENGAKIDAQNDGLDGLSGRSTVTIETAAKMIGCEMKYVKQLRSRGRLKTSPRNNELITVASIKSYNAARRKTNQKPQESDDETQLSAAQ